MPTKEEDIFASGDLADPQYRQVMEGGVGNISVRVVPISSFETSPS